MGVGSLLIFFTNPGFIAFSNLLRERSIWWVVSHKIQIIKYFLPAHKDFSVTEKKNLLSENIHGHPNSITEKNKD